MSKHDKKNRLVVALCVILLVGSSNAIAAELEPLFHQLDNGLKIVLIEDRAVPLVSVQLWFRTGAAADPPTMPGICHISRALLQNHENAAARVVAAGMSHDSKALEDACYFHERGPSGAIDFLLQLQRDRLAAAQFSDDVIRAAVEIASRGNGEISAQDLRQPAWHERRAAIFPDHPYGKIPGVVSTAAAKATPEQIREFANKWFVPANARLVIYGDISSIQLRERCGELFGGLPWREAPDLYIERPNRPTTETIIRSHGEQPASVFAWRTDPYGSFDNAAVAVLGEYLLNPIDGLIATHVTAMTDRIEFVQNAFRYGGFTSIHFRMQENGGSSANKVGSHHDELKRIVRDELKKVANEPPNLVRLARAQSLAAAKHRDRMSTFSQRAFAFGYGEAVAGDALIAQFEEEAIGGVRALEMQAAAKMLANVPMVVQQISPQAAPDTPPFVAPAPVKVETTIALDSPGSAPHQVELGKFQVGTEVARWQSKDAAAFVSFYPIASSDVAFVLSGRFSASGHRPFDEYCSLNLMRLEIDSVRNTVVLNCDRERWQSALERLLDFSDTSLTNRTNFEAQHDGRLPSANDEMRLTIVGACELKALEKMLQERLQADRFPSNGEPLVAEVIRAAMTKKLLRERIQNNDGKAESVARRDKSGNDPSLRVATEIERVRLWCEMQSAAEIARHLHRGLVLPWHVELQLAIEELDD